MQTLRLLREMGTSEVSNRDVCRPQRKPVEHEDLPVEVGFLPCLTADMLRATGQDTQSDREALIDMVSPQH